MPGDRKCIHAGCLCLADPGSDYCSTQCQMSAGNGGTACPCTHELCREKQQLGHSPTPSGSYDPAMSERDREKPLMADWSGRDKH